MAKICLSGGTYPNHRKYFLLKLENDIYAYIIEYSKMRRNIDIILMKACKL